ncbi:AI-2E family transporter [bacterium]|nr:AI-2E family transporter [bacterium]
MKKDFISRIFLLFLLITVIIACYFVFRPFLVEFFVATVLTSIFYRPYKWLSGKIGKRFASLVMCVFIVLLVIIPLVNLIILSAQKSISAYSTVTEFVNNNGLKDIFGEDILVKAENFFGVSGDSMKGLIIDSAKSVRDILWQGATIFVSGTTSFIISLIAIIFIMFFFFVDGERMARRLMDWTPLPNEHDEEIFHKFRDVSYSTVLATFVTAVAQGFIAGIGFFIVGVPVFFLSILVAFFSLIPYIGSGIIWFPVGLYLLLIGNIWQGVFEVVWGARVISFSDDIISAYIIKGKSQVHPIFIVFSIFGGIVLFGFWGVIIGPLIISLTLTILHIYEIEYKDVLQKDN